ncbi:hypothetical protein BC828DRAFT_380073 [Blastocladiella britannica]|nr:hypothetical protein BC828DRAFT_380073 [Blastocladiella britannica]
MACAVLKMLATAGQRSIPIVDRPPRNPGRLDQSPYRSASLISAMNFRIDDRPPTTERRRYAFLT